MAQNNDRVDEFYRAAISAGARENISPRAGVEYYPGYFGRNLDGNRPHLGPGLEWSPAERRSRLAIFAKLLIVKIDSTWRIPWDGHPDARTAQAIAGAIVIELQWK